MKNKRRRFSPDFKAKVALEAMKEDRTLNELATAFDLHPNQISQWKRELQERLPDVFRRESRHKHKQEAELRDRLYRQIGQLQVEVDWLKKKSGLLD